MKNNFYSKKTLCNVYTKPTSKSEVSSQILYGEKFSIISKNKKWIKIKTDYDNYTGYIKYDKFTKNFKPTHKIFKLKAQILKKLHNKFVPIKRFLYFASRITQRQQCGNFIEFEKNRWVKKIDTKEINHQEKNILKVLKIFLNTKYLWGGKTAKGIDCSAFIQIFFYYNRIFFPRDTKNQLRFCKRTKIKKLGKGDLVFWKGHVGICLNRSQLIHAYGPRKKVLIMPTKSTINLIRKSANLKIKKISNINFY